MVSRLYECRVMHERFSPKPHRFDLPFFVFAMDLDELPALHRRLRLFSFNRRNLYALHECDFFPSDSPVHNRSVSEPLHSEAARSLRARVLDWLSARGIDVSRAGRIELIALPRIAGYTFNPVSFYFCHDLGGRPLAAISEVTNTFREVKLFLLGPDTFARERFHLRVPKHFYVSPFSDVDVSFDITLQAPGERLAIKIDDYAGGRRTLTSTLTGTRHELSDRALAWFSIKYPFATLRTIALIHWHALLLRLKNTPWYRKGARPELQRDLHRPHLSIARPETSADKSATCDRTRARDYSIAEPKSSEA